MEYLKKTWNAVTILSHDKLIHEKTNNNTNTHTLTHQIRSLRRIWVGINLIEGRYCKV